VALAITAIALAIALQLWSAAYRMVHAAGTFSRNPSAELAVTSLRRDVHVSVGVALPMMAPLWSTEPLRLRTKDGGHVRWELEDDVLVRVERLPMGDVRSRQLLIRPLSGWRWRLYPGGLLELELERRVVADPWRVDRATAKAEVHTDRFWFASRGGMRW
jgi:hypothetical protein